MRKVHSKICTIRKFPAIRYMGEVKVFILGERTVMVKYGSQSKSLELIVVAGNEPRLFGINWLKHICLD